VKTEKQSMETAAMPQLPSKKNFTSEMNFDSANADMKSVL